MERCPTQAGAPPFSKGKAVGLDPSRKLPPQIWLVALLIIALAVLLAPVALGRTAEGEAGLLPTFRLVVRPTALPEPSPSPQATPSPTDTAQANSPATVAVTPWPTRAPRPSPTPPPRQDHFWLARPIGPGGNTTVASSYPYGSRMDGSYPIHYGVEFVNAQGTPVLAVGDGVIAVAGDDRTTVYGARDNFYGLLVVLKLDVTLYGQPVFALCGHLSEVSVTVGQRVARGDVIGKVGMTGYAEGPHVHFEVRVGGNDYGLTANPELWLEPHAGAGVLAGLAVGGDGEPLSEARVVITRASSPDIAYRYVVTYPSFGVNPDPAWGENLVLGNLPAGSYTAQMFVANQFVSVPFTIAEGATTWIELRTKR